MKDIISEIKKNKMSDVPSFLNESVQYLTIVGSHAYGVNTDDSDYDIYGFCIPPKHYIFPHTVGIIKGFGNQGPCFDQWAYTDFELDKRSYDLQVYNIVKYFQLLKDNNPNMIDSIYTPDRCVLKATRIGNRVRENRDLFLHAGSYHKFTGYAFSQFHKIRTKNPIGKRAEVVEKFGYDIKFAYHLVRLLEECEDILIHHTINLERSKEKLKSIRRGEWTFEQIEEFFHSKKKYLDELYQTTKLRKFPDESKIKDLLLNCLEDYFGNLSNVIYNNRETQILTDLKNIINRYE